MGIRSVAAGTILGAALAAGLATGFAPGGTVASAAGATASASSVDGRVVPAALVVGPGAAGERVAVTRVIDGDTIEVTGRRTVRLLGIDSCESNTAGGRRATDDAAAALAHRQVTLSAERGVNRDRYDRELRYITMPDGRDFGQMMVTKTHTAVYAGHNDASAAYIATLRRLDTNGRSCGATAPPARPAPPRPTSPAPAPAHAVPYQNCAAARAAGAAPLYRGQPGYSSKLDRDGDGIACE